MAKNYVDLSFQYGAHYLPNGDYIISIKWMPVDFRDYWFCQYNSRRLNYSHDPLNKRGRLWN